MPLFERVRKFFSRTPEWRIEKIAKKLKSRKILQQHEAIEELGASNHPAAIPYLMKLIDNEETGLDLRALSALGKINHPEAIPHLTRILKENRSGVIRAKAAKALGKFDDPGSISVLRQALHDEDEFVRHHAAESLSEINHADVIPALVEVMEGEYRPHGGRFGGEPANKLAARRLIHIARELKNQELIGKEARAFQLVAPHLHTNDGLKMIKTAYQAALKGKITEKNANLYVKQLRALSGSLK